MKCGYVAIIGRPNVGKSTLLNRLIQQKVSITSRKPQTTRHTILGIKTEDAVQTIFVDTPGIHRKQYKAINRLMNRAAFSILEDVQVILWVVDTDWTEEETHILSRLQSVKVPVILVINKVDKIAPKERLLPYLKTLATRFNFMDIIPISAKHGTQVDVLEKAIVRFLPEQPFIFDEGEVTDRSVKFLAAEIIREKLMRYLGQELPYEVAVEIDLFEETPEINGVHIAATIYVERDSQKAMVIGQRGEKLKTVGTEARLDIKKMLEKPVYLQLWVKVKSGWSDDERSLRTLGYGG